MNTEIKMLIAAADKAIKEEKFDDLMDFYTDDAVLVVRPGLEAKGKEAIKEAFIKIAAYFKNSVVPTQGKMLMIEAGDTVLVLSLIHISLTVGTVIHIVCQGKYLGNIVVADKIKDTTIEGIKRLKKEGIQNTVMLTGDRREVAKDIAKKIGIDTVYSELLPQDKVMQVENLINQGARLSFVGDGINDAPVLARADLGIAMGLSLIHI